MVFIEKVRLNIVNLLHLSIEVNRKACARKLFVGTRFVKVLAVVDTIEQCESIP